MIVLFAKEVNKGLSNFIHGPLQFFRDGHFG
jgi:hypothetical protein